MMVRCAAFGVFLLTVLAGVGCNGAVTPTSPTPTAAQSRTVDWSCFSAGVDCPTMSTQTASVAEDPPGSPFNLTYIVAGSTVTITWNAPFFGGAPVTYVVEAGSASGLSNIAVFVTGNSATALTVPGVPAGTYYVRIRARNFEGTSGTSNEVVIAVRGAPPAPPRAPTRPDIQPRVANTGVVISECSGGGLHQTFSITAPANVTWTISSLSATFNRTSGSGSESVVATVARSATPIPGPGWYCSDSDATLRRASFLIFFGPPFYDTFNVELTYYQTLGNLLLR